nr:MAG TPA: hypothetical protein [Caudoviricetes sp.]
MSNTGGCVIIILYLTNSFLVRYRPGWCGRTFQGNLIYFYKFSVFQHIESIFFNVFSIYFC